MLHSQLKLARFKARAPVELVLPSHWVRPPSAQRERGKTRSGSGGAFNSSRPPGASPFGGSGEAAQGGLRNQESMVRIVPRDVQQVVHLVAVVHAVALVPAADDPHDARHHQSEGGNGAKHRQAQFERQAVERPQP